MPISTVGTAQAQNGRLMIILHSGLSDFIAKGEVIARYLNPGDVFDEVHIVLINHDVPDLASIQRMVGGATPYLYNLPAGARVFVQSLGWRPKLLGAFAKQAIELAKEIHPALIRCYGARLNGFLAARIKEALGIPYVLSLHTTPGEPVHGRTRNWSELLIDYAHQDIERIGLANADLVMPVYESVVPFLQRLGLKNHEVCYNVLNPEHLTRKEDYQLHDPVRVISVGRQLGGKNPENVIRAVADLPGVHLTVVGDGPYHDHLCEVAADCGAGNRTVFHRAWNNDELCRRLPDFDIFAAHTEYAEIPKSVLEPLLTGLPIVINRRIGRPVPELTEEICLLVRNTAADYRRALTRLIEDSSFRERLGRSAFEHAQRNWAPAITESKFGLIHRRYMRANG